MFFPGLAFCHVFHPPEEGDHCLLHQRLHQEAGEDLVFLRLAVMRNIMGLSFSTPCAGVRGNERALFELEENVLFVCSNIAE